jgi:hypothetical protein
VLVEAVLASLISKLEILLLFKLVFYFEFIHLHFHLVVGTIVGSDAFFLGLFLVIYIYQLGRLSWLTVIP